VAGEQSVKTKYCPSESELAIIREHYDGSTFAIGKIMRLLGGKYPRWHVRKLAAGMGLARVKEPDWIPAEESYLQEHYPQMGLKALRAGLIRAGHFPRSTTAIHLKIKRLRISAAYDDGFSLRGLQAFLWGGQEQHHIVTRWMEKGWLRGKRRGTLRSKSQGGDVWYFSLDNVRAFIISHPEELDLRLVDPVAFIRLLAGDSETMVACRCPRCGLEWEKMIFAPGVSRLHRYCDACRIAVDGAGEPYRIGVL
jgi:hypothetical protein